MDLEFHPLADAFPLIEGNEFAELVQSIKESGQRELIVLYDGKILDGRNRYRACREAGIEPRVRDFNGTDPVKFVIDANIRRRHLNESQRGMAAAAIAKLGEGRPKTEPVENKKEKTAPIGAVSQTDVAKMLNVGRRSVQRGRKVINKGTKAVQDAVKQGKVSLNKASKIASLPQEQQSSALKQATQPKPKRPTPSKDNVVSIRHRANLLDDTCDKIKRALVDLSGLQSADEVAKHFRNLDSSFIVDERLDGVIVWLTEFSRAWERTRDAQAVG